nr:Mpo1-like protein [Mucilaginibacter sp. UR6-1]
MLFAAYEAAHQHPVNKLVSRTATPLLFFSVFALIWALPFPYIAFLGKYNGFVNWASFLLAFSVFYYYRLSPVLSYFILFTYFAFSYFIIQLEQVEKAGGPALFVVPLILFVISITAMFISQTLEKGKLSMAKQLKNIIVAPIYLWYLILKRLPLRF